MKLSSRLAAAALSAIALTPTVSTAGIAGFGDFSNFTINQGDTGSAPTINITTGSIQLTHDNDESRSIFCDSLQDITNFTASFTYQGTNETTNQPGPIGAFFVLQNSPSGADSVAAFNFSYYGLNSGFGNSADIGLEYEDSGTTTYTSLYTNGGSGGGNPTMPLNILSGDPINVTITYNGTVLQESLVDSATSASYSTSYPADLKSIVGESTAYVGFTAGDGNAAADQTISNFQFVAAPEPASLSLLAIASLTLFGRPRRNY